MNKDTKGYWEYSIFQKIIIPNEEQNIKTSLRPDDCFDPKHVHNYIKRTLSKEEQLEEIVKNNGILNKSDKIIYDNYISNIKLLLQKDMDEIKNLGLKAKPKTQEGKIHYIMMVLDSFLKKKSYENIGNIYLKLKNKEYDLTPNLELKYNKLLNDMNKIVSTLDLIELQFTKFHSHMPPLCDKGFKQFDDWQIKVIENIDNNISTIISAPTSAGKSVLSGYAITKGRTLYIVPTDALAWQVASYIGNITNSDVPIITSTYQSIPRRDEFIKLVDSSIALVGTPECILDYLPFINNNFNWIVFDEIHMIGRKEGYAMEMIAKVLNNIPFLALSATIGNGEELKEWFTNINTTIIDYIVCDKRFFNLQKYYYNNKKIIMLNPLSLVDITEFEDGSILNKILNPTPPDTWTLVKKLQEYGIKLDYLEPQKYFKYDEQIELNKTIEYFNALLQFMVLNFHIYKNQIKMILNDFSNIQFIDEEPKLIDLLEVLKTEDKFPAIIFQQNTVLCLQIARKLSNDINIEEQNKYPNLIIDRLKQNKKTKQNQKKSDKDSKDITEKQEIKKMLEGKEEEVNILPEDINAPHNDFIYNTKFKFTEINIKEWAEKYKMYFPSMDGDYHFLIKLLWRGIGVYTIGLPDGYLRLVQSLASKKKLAVVFSDISLVFGISMPFRTTIIYKPSNSQDVLDSMLYHQMAGRAGRRGLDKEGNVIFIGYSWNRIKELSVSSIPIIKGAGKLNYTNMFANEISNNKNNYLLINGHMLKAPITNEEIIIFNNDISNNFNTIWNIYDKNDKNLLQLLWCLRGSNESIIIMFLIPYIRRYFNNMNANIENNQIEISYFLSKFIHIKETDNENNILNDINYKYDFNFLYTQLDRVGINISRNIDNSVWLSIKNNCLIRLNDDELRQDLFDYSTKLKILQHYCFHSKYINLTKLLGKLLTRIWWIYHSSSAVIR
jgi:superfamily II DNA or RNA helicase